MTAAMPRKHIRHVGNHHAVLAVPKADRDQETSFTGIRRAYTFVRSDSVDKIHCGAAHNEHRFKILYTGCGDEVFQDSMALAESKLRHSEKFLVIVGAVSQAFGIEFDIADGAKRFLLFLGLDRSDLQHSFTLFAVKPACFFDVSKLFVGKRTPFSDGKPVQAELSDPDAVQALDGESDLLAHLADLAVSTFKKLH